MSRVDATAGRRDRLVTVQQLVSSSDGGFPVESWVPYATVFAHREDLSARERFSFTAAQETASYDSRWTLPWLPDMDPSRVDVAKQFRLVVVDRVHDIVAAIEIQRAAGLELTTLAGAILTTGPGA